MGARGSNAHRPTNGNYNPFKTAGSWSGNRGRLSIDEIRLWGSPDGQNAALFFGGQNGVIPIAGSGKYVNTNSQARSGNIYYPGDIGSIINAVSGTTIINNTGAAFSAAYNTAGRMKYMSNSTSNNAAFEANSVIENMPGYAVTLPAFTTAVGGNLFIANGATVSLGTTQIDFISNGAFSTVNSGTLTVGTFYNYQAKNTVINSGATVTTRVGYRVEDSTPGGGTLTTQVGLDIPAMTGGTTNIGIRNASSLNQQGAMIATNNTITVTSNAGTANVTGYLQTFTNSSAAAMTITLTTTGATDGQKKMVRIYDFSAVAEGITWVNVTNTSVTAPATSNGSTTKPLYVAFMYASTGTTWHCVGYA